MEPDEIIDNFVKKTHERKYNKDISLQFAGCIGVLHARLSIALNKLSVYFPEAYEEIVKIFKEDEE